MSLPLAEVIHIPQDIAGRFTIEAEGGMVIDVSDKTDAVLRFDSGRQIFSVPLNLELMGDAYRYIAGPNWGLFLGRRGDILSTQQKLMLHIRTRLPRPLRGLIPTLTRPKR